MRARNVVLLAASLLLAVPMAAAAGEPIGVCAGGECQVTDDLTPQDIENLGDDWIATDEADPPGEVVCVQGQSTCNVKTPELTIDEVELTTDGRVVYGAVDGDMTGSWRLKYSKGVMRCKVKGFGTQKLKIPANKDIGVVSRREDGRLGGVTDYPAQPSFVLARLGPGLYGTVQEYNVNRVKGKLTTYMGMASEDSIRGVDFVEADFKIQGRKAKCTMDRTIDGTRVGPGEGPPSADEPAQDEAAEEDTAEEMEFSEDEVEDEAAEEMEFSEDEVEDASE